MKFNWLTYAILGLLSLGGMSFLISYVTKKGYPVSFVLFFIVLMLSIGYGLQSFVFTRPTLAIDPKLILLLLVMGILSYFGNLFSYQAANDAPNAGLAIAIVGLQGVVVSALSFIFLKDKLSTLQLLGIALGIIAIFLISAGSKSDNKKSASIKLEPITHQLEK